MVLKIKNFLKIIHQYFVTFGMDPLKTINSIRGLPIFIYDYYRFKRQQPKHESGFPFSRFSFSLDNFFSSSLNTNNHYFYQDLLVASRIFENQPEKHIDVGSRIDGFVAHVASFREIVFIDIRPVTNNIHNVEFIQADLMKELSPDLVESCDSLSCLHVLEHFGLGRYGDPVCWEGYRIGFENLLKMLKPNGKLYFSVPIGNQRIEFNSHRVFSISFLLEMFSDRLKIDNFSYVDDMGEFYENVILDKHAIESNLGCYYGCGIFELTKY